MNPFRQHLRLDKATGDQTKRSTNQKLSGLSTPEDSRVWTADNGVKMDLCETPGERIRRLMRSLGIDHYELARRTGLGQDYVLKVIQDQTGITPAIRERISQLLSDPTVPSEVWEKLATALESSPHYLQTGLDKWLVDSLHNLEEFIQHHDIADDEAHMLRSAVKCGSWKRRPSMPLSERDFRALSKKLPKRRCPEPVLTGWVYCTRCHNAVDIDATHCPSCGRLVDFAT